MFDVFDRSPLRIFSNNKFLLVTARLSANRGITLSINYKFAFILPRLFSVKDHVYLTTLTDNVKYSYFPSS